MSHSTHSTHSRKNIVLVATGGTIAGRAATSDELTHYTAGVLNADDLVAAVPELLDVAAIRTESPYQIDSKDITPDHWLQLARRVNELLAAPSTDGIVITHGTDTIEETAWLLHLSCPASKPVVLTCAMRPATAHSADGPLNLLHAVQVAANGCTTGLGVVVVANGEIHGARRVEKTDTCALTAIQSRPFGPLGYAVPPQIVHRPEAHDAGLFDLRTTTCLPEIDLIAVPGGASTRALSAAIDARIRGLVLALPGNGSLPMHWKSEVDRALSEGVAVVRATRTGQGLVTDAPEPAGALSAGRMPPAKARIALMLALATDQLNEFKRLARS